MSRRQNTIYESLPEAHYYEGTEVETVSESDWDSIVLANSAVVTAAALRILGCLSDAEDVAQEVFLEAFQKWGTGSDNAWSGLLRRMAVCRSLDLLRCRRRIDALVFQPADLREMSPEESLLRQESHDLLRMAVAELPNRESEVFCLVCFEGLSHEQIAGALQISRGAVATLLSKARAKLVETFQSVRGESL